MIYLISSAIGLVVGMFLVLCFFEVAEVSFLFFLGPITGFAFAVAWKVFAYFKKGEKSDFRHK